MSKAHTPILVGAGQYSQPKDADPALDPLRLMIIASHNALIDAGKEKLKDLIDTVYVVNIQSLTYEDAPGMLGDALDIKPKHTFYSAVGGNSPQMFVNLAARAIASGKSRAILMAGGEAIYSVRRASKGEIALNWPEKQSPGRIDGEERQGTNSIEGTYGLFPPTHMYAFFETAFRGASGRTIDSHRQYMGRVCEHLSRVASQNPYSWIKTVEPADVLITPTPENRYITYPYTKRMTANMFVDQSAALVMTSEEDAEQLGIDPALWVYPMGGGELNDIWYVSRRPRLHEVPAGSEASRMALDQSGIGLDDIGIFDFYSCFPCAVEIVREELGISENDPRDFSVTGGLPYFGGPMNNYSMHAVATVMEKIRKNPQLHAMVTSMGWYMTKHSVVIYGSKPGRYPWEEIKQKTVQQAIDEKALPEPVEKANGQLTVEAYIVIHDRSGKPERGVVMGRLNNGLRALSDIDAEEKALSRFEEIELVGQTGEVRFDQDTGRNRITFTGIL